MTKRLDRRHFTWPRHVDGSASRIVLAPEAFAMLTDGIDMKQATIRPWYDRE